MSALRIPALIHQTWRTAEVPARFVPNAESWRERHPAWSYRLWTDADLEAFVREEFPELFGFWQDYPDAIQRVDSARYMILSRLGGLYADLDIECLRPFDSLRGERLVLAPTRPLGVSNDLMLAAPGEELMARAVAGLRRAKRWLPRGLVPRHLRVLGSTGSLYLSAILRQQPRDQPVHLLARERYDSQDRARAWVYHHPGNTWAAADTRLVARLFYGH